MPPVVPGRYRPPVQFRDGSEQCFFAVRRSGSNPLPDTLKNLACGAGDVSGGRFGTAVCVTYVLIDDSPGYELLNTIRIS